MSNVTEHHPINVCSLHSPGADPGGGAPGAHPPPHPPPPLKLEEKKKNLA